MLKAINGNVFIKRDEKESDVQGIDISEGAQIKAIYGTIMAIDGKCLFAEVGDRVHIPHFGVSDAEVDGVEYAICKTSRLFFVNGDPVNGYVLVRKCENDHIRNESGEIALYMTEKHIEFTNWVEVLDPAKDCKYIKADYSGLYCPAPENDEKLARIGNSKDFCLHEDLIKLTTDRENMIKPIGNAVILRVGSEKTDIFGVISDTPVYEVVSVGTGTIDKSGDLVPIDLPVGSYVFTANKDIVEIILEGVKYILTSDDNILSVLTEK